MFTPSSKSKEGFRNDTRIKVRSALNIWFVPSIVEAVIQHRHLPPHLRCPPSNLPLRRCSMLLLEGLHSLSLCLPFHPLPGQSGKLLDPIAPRGLSDRQLSHRLAERTQGPLKFQFVGRPL